MSFEEFKSSLAVGQKPASLSLALTALWLDGTGDWEGAHQAAQADSGLAGSWVHAYLHRKEADEGNAGYWYSRAKRSAPEADVTLQQEWSEIARELLGRG